MWPVLYGIFHLVIGIQFIMLIGLATGFMTKFCRWNSTYRYPVSEVARLCREPQCVNFQYLSLEPRNVSKALEKCFNRGICEGHAPLRGNPASVI